MKTVVQCDFDGTITTEDVSFYLLDAFARDDWRGVLREYEQDKITVGQFNSRVFAMVKAEEWALVDTVRRKAQFRGGFLELVRCCHSRGFRFVIVSNGLEFYIHALLETAGLQDIEVHAARAQFLPQGVMVQYLGPDGSHNETGLKEPYVRQFLEEGYRVLYVGNGRSDRWAARHAHEVFATGELLHYCRREHLRCRPFADLTDVAHALQSI